MSASRAQQGFEAKNYTLYFETSADDTISVEQVLQTGATSGLAQDSKLYNEFPDQMKLTNEVGFMYASNCYNRCQYYNICVFRY